MDKEKVNGILDNMETNGMALRRGVLEFIFRFVPEGYTILELGSGISTKYLSKYFEVYSVEHDKKFIDETYNNTFIYAPLQLDGWYNLVQEQLPQHYNVLLIDGPVGDKNRIHILDHLHLFKWYSLIIIDNIERPLDREVFDYVSSKVGRENFVVTLGANKFGIIMPEITRAYYVFELYDWIKENGKGKS